MYMSINNGSLKEIWVQVKQIIKTTLDNDNKSIAYNEFFDRTELEELNDREAIISTDFEIHYIVLNDNENLSIINNALKAVLNSDVRARVVLKSTYQKNLLENVKKMEINDNLMPEYTFENFVTGPSNKESYAACLAVAMSPGRNTYNPLFIYGDSGLGKTHLLCAIGNYIKKNYPEKKILYISSNTFVNHVVSSIKQNKIDEFKERLNSLDLLMMDDVQFLSGKDKTNEVFFDIYNELFNNRKQIVLTSDRSPAQIKDIEERLISRFSQGLSVTVTTPVFETAYQILEMKIKMHGIDASSIDPEVLSFLATNFASDVRNLEGSLNRLLFYSINFSRDNVINLNLAMEAFRGNISTSSANKKLEINDVVNAVADYYGFTKQQLYGKNRTKNIAVARHIAMYLCRKHLDVSYKNVGYEFGGRDHSTVLSACDKVEKLISTNESFRKAVTDIEKNL